MAYTKQDDQSDAAQTAGEQPSATQLAAGQGHMTGRGEPEAGTCQPGTEQCGRRAETGLAGGGASIPASTVNSFDDYNSPRSQTSFMCPLWMELKKPWRKRHPVKFWLGILIVLFLVLPGIVYSVGGDISGKDKVAIVNIDGIILNGSQVIKWVETVQADPLVKGVLVRVNSPGGAVTPSQEMYFAIKRLASQKPVVVSMGALAASGGYYVSLPAKQIFAVPSTVTGSIGVKMDLTNVENLMGKLGVESTSLASGALKDAGSPFKSLRDDERQYFLGVIMDMYDDFLTTVIEHRQITAEQLEGFADGRALTGRQAKELGLVDQLGDKNDALTYLYQECGLTPKNSRLVEGPVKDHSFLERLTDSAVDSLLSKGLGGRSTAGPPVFMYR